MLACDDLILALRDEAAWCKDAMASKLPLFSLTLSLIAIPDAHKVLLASAEIRISDGNTRGNVGGEEQLGNDLRWPRCKEASIVQDYGV